MYAFEYRVNKKKGDNDNLKKEISKLTSKRKKRKKTINFMIEK